TTACKAIAWDKTGKLVAEGRAEFDLLSPNPNWYEQRAEDWWTAFAATTRQVVEQVGADRIAAVCITHQRETFVPVDENGKAIYNALLWLDGRAKSEVEWLDEKFGNDNIHQLTGKGPAAVQSLPKLVWFTEHEPRMVERAYKFLDTHAFLVQRLTGNWITGLPCADPMGIVDMKNGTWATDLIKDIGLRPDQFVDIAMPGDIIGEVTEEAAKLTALPAGTIVVAGAGDGQSAGLGANITSRGKAYLNLGTAMVSGAYADEFVADRAFRTLCSPIAGKFVPEEVLGGGTFTISWFVRYFAPDVEVAGMPLSIEEILTVAAQKVPPGSLGLMTVPYWNGVMPPHWDARATGMTIGWTGAHRREHFYRSILEGIAFEHRLAMEGVGRATDQTIDEFIVMGGGSKSDLWCQIVADISSATVKRASTAEATNLGAGILAAAAAGWYGSVQEAADGMTSTTTEFYPDEKTHAVYDKLFDVYVELFPALKKHIDTLAELTYDD
ncbi:MAG: FGGY family carbohydrate kinase, partial [Chloroflexota bacterium]